ncbi:nucleotidyl transferase AbiEii/AbiGii toxin family protein [bacterium]|nr:nucleotidyl transferase AbiEii/AbiGii toxin family protein [bacterium]
MEQAIISLQIDLRFNDVVYPEPVSFSCPTLLSVAALPLYAYSWETVIAEKSQAIVSYQKRPSRMKDLYDIYFLMHTIPFKAATLCRAIEKTFVHRETPLEECTLF